MPADRRWIKKNCCPLQGRKPRAFGIPLIPADQRAQTSSAGVEGAKSEVAGREVKLFVIQGIVGNVHLAVKAAKRAVAVENRRRIVVNAGGTFFEEGSDDHDPMLARGRGNFLAGRAGNRFGQVEQRMILALAEILGLKKLRQADDLGPASGSVGKPGDGFFQILLRLWPAGHLHQSHAKFFRRHALSKPPTNNIAGEKLSALSGQLSAKAQPHPGWNFDLRRPFLLRREGAL